MLMRQRLLLLLVLVMSHGFLSPISTLIACWKVDRYGEINTTPSSDSDVLDCVEGWIWMYMVVEVDMEDRDVNTAVSCCWEACSASTPILPGKYLLEGI